jgi:hypothetical protein
MRNDGSEHRSEQKIKFRTLVPHADGDPLMAPLEAIRGHWLISTGFRFLLEIEIFDIVWSICGFSASPVENSWCDTYVRFNE